VSEKLGFGLAGVDRKRFWGPFSMVCMASLLVVGDASRFSALSYWSSLKKWKNGAGQNECC
jgi:hypothetical protein